MQQAAWHPYAPDQAFGWQAARDEELIERLVARLDRQHRRPPRPGNKAPGPDHGAIRFPAGDQLAWLAQQENLGPVTTAAALDAAPLVQGRPL